MSRSIRRCIVVLVMIVLATPITVLACPICKKSPNGWGFCGYGGIAGGVNCIQDEPDPWSGKTYCHLEGVCNWHAGGGDGGGVGGPYYPEGGDPWGLTAEGCSTWTDTPSECVTAY